MQYLSVLYGNMRNKMEQLRESEMMELLKKIIFFPQKTNIKRHWYENSFIVNSDTFWLHPPCFLQKNSIIFKEYLLSVNHETAAMC